MASETINGLVIKVQIYGSVIGTDGVKQDVNILKEFNISEGTGINQIGAVYQDLTRGLNATTETLDLDGLTDFKGATMSDNNNVKFLYMFHNSSTPAAVLKVGGGDFAGAAGPLVDATDKMAIGPQGLILMVNPIDGWGITASTKDGLLVETTTNTTYDTLIGFDNT